MSSMLAVVALLAVVMVVVAVIVVVILVLLVRSRRTPARYAGPVAAPGAADARAEGAGLALRLDEQISRAGTTAEFARLQLGEAATGPLARALDEGRGAAAELGQALAATQDASTEGPGGTAAAGRLAAALSRARAAQAALTAAETEVATATRRLDPPPA